MARLILRSSLENK